MKHALISAIRHPSFVFGVVAGTALTSLLTAAFIRTVESSSRDVPIPAIASTIASYKKFGLLRELFEDGKTPVLSNDANGRAFISASDHDPAYELTHTERLLVGWTLADLIQAEPHSLDELNQSISADYSAGVNPVISLIAPKILEMRSEHRVLPERSWMNDDEIVSRLSLIPVQMQTRISLRASVHEGLTKVLSFDWRDARLPSIAQAESMTSFDAHGLPMSPRSKPE